MNVFRIFIVFACLTLTACNESDSDGSQTTAQDEPVLTMPDSDVILEEPAATDDDSTSNNDGSEDDLDEASLMPPVVDSPPATLVPADPDNSAVELPVDTRVRLIQQSPAPDSTNRGLSTTVSMMFSEPLMADLVNSDNVRLTVNGEPVSADLSVKGRRITLSPETRLLPSMVYQVELNKNTDTKLMSEQGGILAPVNWTFKTTKKLGSTSQKTIDECMSQTDIDMLHAVNNIRQNGYQCGRQQQPQVPDLKWHCDVETAAEDHSDDMADNQFMSHTGSDGSSASDRVSQADYQWVYVAENVAVGADSVGRVMRLWLDSPGHCKNIMSPKAVDFGAGWATGDNGRRYWTQNFTSPR